MEVPLGDTLRTLPRGIDHEAHYLDLTLIYPERMRHSMAPNPKNTEFYMTFESRDHEKSYADMERTLESMEDQVRMYNVAEANELSRATILIVRIFTYGFIFLIVLTSTVNILNVLSANVILRRRELAMLRSVGMTRRGFFKMSAFESFLYGSKGSCHCRHHFLLRVQNSERECNRQPAAGIGVFPYSSSVIKLSFLFAIIYKIFTYHGKLPKRTGSAAVGEIHLIGHC